MSGENVKVLNVDAVEPERHGHGEAFEAETLQLGRPLGARKLGYQVIVVAEGKSPFPLHFHWHNEEMFFVLEGQGALLDGAGERPLRAGDVIACPPGPGSEHRLVGGPGGLRVLAVSTRESPEIVEYPDSDKLGVMGVPTVDGPDARPLRQFMTKGETRDYWDGEG